MSNTRSIIPLNDESISAIRLSLTGLDNLWKKHEIFGGIKLGKTNPGKTIWLHHRTKESDWLTHHNTNLHLLVDFIKNTAIELHNSHHFGRTYIHRLQPTQEVTAHVDAPWDPAYFNKVTRYQIFLDIPEHIEIVSTPMPEQNSLILFRNDILHSYRNNSTIDLTFIVFDIFNSTSKPR
jgi:hypothetical protein